MSGDWELLLEVALVLFTYGVLGFSALRAFEARRVLASPAYRSRALLNLVFAIFFIPFELAAIVFLGGPAGFTPEYALVLGFTVAFNIAAFFFLNSTIVVARQMDFFHRDTLRWGKTRWVAFGLLVVGMVGTLSGPQGGIQTQLLNFIWALAFGYCAIVLVAASLRVRDRIMRTYAKWIGLFAGVVTLPFFYQGVFYQGASNYPVLVAFAIASPIYYRATVSLLITGQVTQTSSP